MTTMVTREEKLILQMKNIEAMVTSKEMTAEQKVFAVTQQMSYLNELVNSIIAPFREEAGNSYLIQLANDTFVNFIEEK
jgi:uncharacterized protein YpmS